MATSRSRRATSAKPTLAGEADVVLRETTRQKNKLINFLAFKSIGVRHVEFHYLSVIADPSMAEATKQALEFTDGFRYTFLPTVLGEDVGGAVLNHRDNRVPVQTVRRWHDALIKAVESIGEEFAKKLAQE